jgi:hypothetical protein
MSCNVHEQHSHTHGQDCGHKAVKHDDHTDYLHDGHLHHVHDDHVDEHKLDEKQAAACSEHTCSEHEKGHKHGQDCGHESIPHGDHTDYVVSGHLHNQHSDHCDKHGDV